MKETSINLQLGDAITQERGLGGYQILKKDIPFLDTTIGYYWIEFHGQYGRDQSGTSKGCTIRSLKGQRTHFHTTKKKEEIICVYNALNSHFLTSSRVLKYLKRMATSLYCTCIILYSKEHLNSFHTFSYKEEKTFFFLYFSFFHFILLPIFPLKW